MTVESCASFCSDWPYFGIEYGGQCYCGQDLPSESAPETDCNMACDGNSAELCGAGWRLSTYQNLDYVPVSTPPIPGWTYSGCYLDQGNPRSLPDANTASNNLTLEDCAAFCDGYSFFGTEYSSQCYCGYVLNAAAVQEPATDCNMVCAGNETEYCGGSWRLTVYASTTLAPPSIPSTVAGYTSLGCWTDNVDGRALPNLYANNSMTLEMCAAVATEAGATYWGAEYGRECWYGSNVSGGNNVTSLSACDMTCMGNSSEYCGGSNALSMYYLSGSSRLRI